MRSFNRFHATKNLDSTLYLQPYKVDEAGFRGCDISGGVPVINDKTDQQFTVDQKFLQPGTNYFVCKFQKNFGVIFSVSGGFLCVSVFQCHFSWGFGCHFKFRFLLFVFCNFVYCVLYLFWDQLFFSVLFSLCIISCLYCSVVGTILYFVLCCVL